MNRTLHFLLFFIFFALAITLLKKNYLIKQPLHLVEPSIPKPKFDTTNKDSSFSFLWEDPESPYLKKLRTRFNLEKIIVSGNNDYEKILEITNWVHNLWEHSGTNEPTASDPLSILEAVENGEKFRCVEYSIVIAGCLNSLGIPSRVLALKTADVETRKSGAGHVIAEAYLEDRGKWIMIDGQMNVVPILDETPLNALELQQALAQNKESLSVASSWQESTPLDARKYFRWILPYLYYFDVHLDNRYLLDRSKAKKVMLVPIGAKKPKVFQRNTPMKNILYTHSVQSFYQKPEGFK